LLVPQTACGQAPAKGDGPIALHYGSDFRKMTRAVAATKAVEAMVVKQNFIHAEINGDGDVFGQNEDSTALVSAVPVRDGVEIYVVVASRSNDEAARLRSAIRAHVFDGPYNPKIPRKMSGKPEGRRSRAPAMHLGGAPRQQTLAAFQASGRASLARLGLPVQPGKDVFGLGTRAAAVAFYLPLGGNKAYLSVVAAAFDYDEAAYLRSAVRADIWNEVRGAAAFGYENRKVTGQRPLLFLWARDSKKPKSKHEFAYYEQLIFGSKDPKALSVNGYLAEVSHGKFAFRPAGKLGPYEYGKFDGVDYQKIVSDAIRHARDKGKFNFAAYDRNKDGVVTTDELALLLIYNRWNLDGWTRWSFRNTFDNPKLIVDLHRAVGIGEEVGFATLNHETMHSLGTEVEMYEQGFHQNLTVMGGTLYNNPDDRQTYHPDGWLKMQFGWVQPRVLAMQVPGREVLLAQQLRPGKAGQGSVILYDPLRGPKEFFLLEYRSGKAAGGSYDANVSSTGVAIWHVLHGDNKWVTRVKAERNPKATVPSVFNRGAPDWRQGGNQLYNHTHGAITLKWMDGSDSGIRLRIDPPNPTGTQVTIRWDKK
jgi:M6 family metalloprotease-like protein